MSLNGYKFWIGFHRTEKYMFGIGICFKFPMGKFPSKTYATYTIIVLKFIIYNLEIEIYKEISNESKP